VFIAVGANFLVKAKHEFLGENNFKIADFLPTKKRNEFVTIHQIWRDKKFVVAMTFLQLNN
jgi:hypothetical protein